MFDQPHKFKYICKRLAQPGESFAFLHIYSFRDIKNIRYLVHVEEYEYNVLAIKFFPKHHTSSEKRFNIKTGHFDAARVIATCIEIMMDLYRKNPYSSFAFVGSNSIDETENNTQRFRIYRKVMENFFSPIHFAHYSFPPKSVYMMLNRDSSEANLPSKVEQMFIEIFEIHLNSTI